ncbi:sugar ABC transporter substrate-binding protein [Cryobacterium sp. Hh7]|uniref:ABC transporter substrate-binding protein n=1 Tax=Cryobacterium sp. Hh7 TaxID=1259159 RepID=UPI00106A932F|nr:sugar ABC transporter substrate-binding protein [Cryobacterium sp. Hh7]TFD56951.1 sugar ABC transporter substrate-binding protein [Cryobacterium sp. Hh7]
MSSISRKRTALVASTLFGALALTSCASGGGEQPAASNESISMWARAATASQSQALVDAYNKSHDQKVELTVVPTDSYLQKVGVAAGADQLPCVMASDVVYMPNFVTKNLYVDITDRVEALDFADELAQGHINLASEDGKIYGVPHNVAVSAIFQNDVLLEKAGIDPTKKLASLEELASNAAKVAALGGDYSGLYYTGNNAGSISFTHFPAIWASGGEAISEDGTESLLDSEESVAVFDAFNKMFASGASPDSVRNESGATRNEVFGTGNVGYVLASNSVLETVPETEALKIGVQGIPGVGGGESAYVGGDAVGISSSCKDVDGAWDFLSWTIGEEAQVDVFAKMNQLTVRADLADNQYAAADPRVVKLNELVGIGDTPKALNYGQTFNDPNGPALSAFREALFGTDAEAALSDANDAISSSLAGN